ncbi:hypothetical protein VTJ04DRAFT_2671 [Mycothermus thermophilus]|uniref:uncharacterized protein n=1 Tax=Humicola insolens TaxID=85995 RepID=UPI0037430F9E
MSHHTYPKKSRAEERDITATVHYKTSNTRSTSWGWWEQQLWWGWDAMRRRKMDQKDGPEDTSRPGTKQLCPPIGHNPRKQKERNQRRGKMTGEYVQCYSDKNSTDTTDKNKAPTPRPPPTSQPNLAKPNRHDEGQREGQLEKY